MAGGECARAHCPWCIHWWFRNDRVARGEAGKLWKQTKEDLIIWFTKPFGLDPVAKQVIKCYWTGQSQYEICLQCGQQICGAWRIQKTTNLTISWKTRSSCPGKDSGQWKGQGGRVRMEKPEGHGPWTSWLQTVQGEAGGNEAGKAQNDF